MFSGTVLNLDFEFVKLKIKKHDLSVPSVLRNITLHYFSATESMITLRYCWSMSGMSVSTHSRFNNTLFLPILGRSLMADTLVRVILKKVSLKN